MSASKSIPRDSAPDSLSADAPAPSPVEHVVAGRTDGLDVVFVQGLELMGLIGVYPHERTQLQRILINLSLDVEPPTEGTVLSFDRVVDYDRVRRAVTGVVESGHTPLVETLAEKIAALCLAIDGVRAVDVEIAKPDAVPTAAAVGVKIRRLR